MNKFYTQISKIAVVSGLLLGSFAVAALADWTAPVANPPTCAAGNPGCDAPINVSNIFQKKAGALEIGKDLKVNAGNSPSSLGFQTWGLSIFNAPVQIKDGSQGRNKIFTSDSTGVGAWKTLQEVAQASGGTGNSEWIPIDSGTFVANGGGQYLSHIKYPAGSEHSAESMCQARGYSHATGACKYEYNGHNYYSTVMSNNELGYWILTCDYGPSGNLTWASETKTQIMCTK